MIIQTKFLGEQEIKNEDVISFETGIPGFVEEKEFYIFPLEDTPLNVLQSIHKKEVAFIITDPLSFFNQYEFVIPQDARDSLKIVTEQDVAVFVILTVKEPFNQTTANLQAPVIINQKSNLGKQLILNYTNYTTKHFLLHSAVALQEGN